MKKRIALVAAVLGAIVLAVAGVATAGTGTKYGSSGSGGASRNGTQVTHYTAAAYPDYFFGSVSCTGVRQVKQAKTQDSFTCTSMSGGPLTNVAPGQTVTLATFGGWVSDFDGKPATSFNGTVSADGMSYSAVATY